MPNAKAIERLFRSVKLQELLKTFYPVLHLMTGPPPLERNGGIWKSVKKHMSEVLDTPNIMVQAFHFTTYNLSKKSWDAWTGTGENNLSNQIRTHFPRGSIFVDSGGYQFLQGDRVDLSKWDIEANQEGIYELQRKYGADKICNLDLPINPNLDSDGFKKYVKSNISNIKKFVDNLKSDTSEAYLVLHGRNRIEIEYFFEKMSAEVDVENPQLNFALGSQVPLLSISKNLVSDNANFTIRMLSDKLEMKKKIHIFGVGSNVIRQVRDTLDLSYDNSTFVRSAMYLKWYDPTLHSFKHFSPREVKTCSCAACKLIRSMNPDMVIDLFVGKKSNADQVTKSDIMGLIALHNIYHEKDRVSRPVYSHGSFPPLEIVKKYDTKKNYEFPLRKYEPNGESLIILQCSSKKPYSKSNSHKRIKHQLQEKQGIVEGVDYDVITLSGLHGPVHWKDEKRPEVLTYDFRLTNLTAKKHISMLKMKTASIIGTVSKRYLKTYSIIGGVYYRTFEHILRDLGTAVYTDTDSFKL